VIGAGTDYGLFLVFRVREELRAGQPPHDAVVRALSRVGESVAFSAATVIAALLTLLLATFGLFSGLGVPLAIAIGLMLAAALTLLPALLAIFGRAAFWPSRITASAGRPGWWGRTASRIVARPAAVLVLGLVVFGGLAVAAVGYTPTGFGATPPAPAGSDSAAGQALLAAHFPAASSNPTVILLRFPAPVWRDPGPAARAEQSLAASPLFTSLGGPLEVNGVTLAPGQLTALHARLGDPRALPAQPRPGSGVTARTWAAYRAESQFISPDGRTVRLAASLAAGDPDSDAALRQVPAIRAATAGAAGAEPDRVHGQLSRAGAGGHVRGVRGGRQPPAGRGLVPGRARLARDRHPDGRFPGPHAAGAVDGGAARPVELVAVPARRQRTPAGRTGGGDGDAARMTSPVSTPARKPMTWAR
jgi:putative drug exporter of the RND superfamily